MHTALERVLVGTGRESGYHTAVDPILCFAQAHQAEMVAMLREFVECESPSDDAAAVNRFVDLVADTVAGYAKVKTVRSAKFGRAMMAEMVGRERPPALLGPARH